MHAMSPLILVVHVCAIINELHLHDAKRTSFCRNEEHLSLRDPESRNIIIDSTTNTNESMWVKKENKVISKGKCRKQSPFGEMSRVRDYAR